MRVLTFLHNDRPCPGALVGDWVIDLVAAQKSHAIGGDPITGVADLIAAGPAAWARLAADLAVADLRPYRLSLADLKLAAPLIPSKIIAIGRNYVEHSTEQAATPPDHPIIFAKYPTTVIGPGDEIRWDPSLATKVDWEAELAVVIGRPTRRVPAADAYSYIFGYTVANDITARDLQRLDGQWVRGKSLDTFCPLGPWIVTADEGLKPYDLAIRCQVNGEVMQNARTDQLIFGIPYLIEYITAAFTLLPGDLILTGTPSGVGAYRNPPCFLRDGDVVTVEVEGIGALTNRCRTEPM